MNALVLASMFAAAAGPANPVAAPQKAFSKCVQTFISSSAEKKVELSAFDSGISSACSREEAAFRTAIVANQVSMKSSRKDAEQVAAEWLTDLKNNAKETYKDMVAQPGT